MATLKDYIEAHVPAELRYGRDFTGARGWCDLTNQLLKRLSRRRLLDLTQRKEVGVEVNAGFWITPPSDFKTLERISYPQTVENWRSPVRYHSTIVNGLIKLIEPFDKMASPTARVLSGGAVDGVTIDDAAATEDQYEDWLLVPTDGTRRTPLIVTENAASSGGTARLSFLTQPAALDSTTGYLTDLYLIMTYQASFTQVVAETDEVPIEDNDEDLLTYGLCMMATPAQDAKTFKLYHDLFDEALREKENEVFTPSEDDARPGPVRMPGLEDCSYSDESDYIGDGADE